MGILRAQVNKCGVILPIKCKVEFQVDSLINYLALHNNKTVAMTIHRMI
jgi:hypothetical protein